MTDITPAVGVNLPSFVCKSLFTSTVDTCDSDLDCDALSNRFLTINSNTSVCKRFGILLTEKNTQEKAKSIFAKTITINHPVFNIQYTRRILPNGEIFSFPNYSFNKLGCDFNDDKEIIYSTDNQIKSLPFLRWIEYIIFLNDNNLEHINRVLINYPSIISARELIWLFYDCISQAENKGYYSNEDIDKGKLQIINFISKWIHYNYHNEWNFSNSNNKQSDYYISKKDILYLARYCKNEEIISNTFNKHENASKISILNDENNESYTSFLDIPIIDFFNHYSSLDIDCLRNISLSEFLDLNWAKKDSKTKSPHLLESINRFNNLGDAITNEIINCKVLEQRALMLVKVVEIAYYCINNNSFPNYNLCMTLLSSIQRSSIYRLKKTWSCAESINSDFKNKFDDIYDILTSNASFRKLRNHMLHHTRVVPYLGVTLTDLTFICEGNPHTYEETCIAGNRVNIQLYKYVSDTLLPFYRNRKHFKDYICTIYPSIDDYLTYNYSEDITYEKSLLLEKRRAQTHIKDLTEIPSKSTKLINFYTNFKNKYSNILNNTIEPCFPNITTLSGAMNIFNSTKDKLSYQLFLCKILSKIHYEWQDYKTSHNTNEIIQFRTKVILPIQNRIIYILNCNDYKITNEDYRNQLNNIQNEIISYCISFKYYN